MKDIIYMDHAATTPVLPEVAAAMIPYLTDEFWNPSSVYGAGQGNKNIINKAREVIGATLGDEGKNIYFTGSGTEADNWAIKATAEAYRHKGNHIITTKIEHHAVLHTCEYLEKNGFEVTYLNVDEDGIVKLDELRAAIKDETILISIMFANNEIGTIQPMAEIGRIAKEKGILFHTDAVQAYCQLPIDVKEMNIDMLSASGHKLYGPKGIGFLYIKQGVKIGSFIHGGAQERKRRAGTENVAGIVGLAKAVELAHSTMKERAEKECQLRDRLIHEITSKIPHIKLNGHPTNRLPNNVNISFRFVEGESILLNLDFAGVCASSGSACTSGSLDPSHVLLAIGLSHEIAHGSLRLTVGHENTHEEVDFVVEKITEAVNTIRSLSPLYDDFLKQESQNA